MLKKNICYSENNGNISGHYLNNKDREKVY